MVNELNPDGFSGADKAIPAAASLSGLAADGDVSLAKESIIRPADSQFVASKNMLQGAVKALIASAHERGTIKTLDLAPNAAEITARLREAAELARTILQALKGYQGIAASDCGRPARATLQLKDLVREFKLFHEGLMIATRNRTELPADQQLFCQVIANNFKNGVGDKQQTDPLSILNRVFGPREMQGKFPTGEGYMKYSSTLAEQLAPIIAEREVLNEARLRLRSNQRQGQNRADGGESGSQEIDQLDEKIRRCKERIRGIVERATDIDLTQYGELLDSVEFNIQLKPAVLSVLQKVSSGLLSAIREIVDDNSNQMKSAVPLLEVTIEGEDARRRMDVESRSVEFIRPSEHQESARYLAVLLDYYLTIREILSVSFSSYAPERPQDTRNREWMEALRGDLSTPFGPRGGELLLSAILKLEDAQYTPIKQRLTEVEVFRAVNGDSGQLAFLMPEYIGIFREFVRRSLTASDAEFYALHDRSRKLNLDGLLEQLPYVRHLAQKSRFKELAALFDRELGATNNFSGEYAHLRRAALLFSLELVSESDDAARALKSTMTKREKIRSLEGDLNRLIGSGQQQVQIGRTVTDIMRRFNPTLSDYLGAPNLVQSVRKVLDGNALLNQEPKRYGGLPTKLAVWNAILLFGPPGVGKTFLIECIANEYGLELVQISREDMERDQREAPKVPSRGGQRRSTIIEPIEAPSEGKSFSRHLTDYLDKKIRDLRAKMGESGASGGIIFIDELEAEFRRRTPNMNSDDVERTNIMLRVIENSIAKNPDILFAAATNSISMLDAAAVRFGRYGIKFELSLVTDDAAREIVRDTANRLYIDAEGLAAAAEYEDLIRAAVGTTPQMLLSALVRGYALRSSDVDAGNFARLNQTFREMLEEAKRLTLFGDSRISSDGRGDLATSV